MVNDGVSIIICCYNSANRIKGTLEKVAAQKFKEPISCEIVLIDNNSSDNTADLASVTWSLLGDPFPLRIIKEEKQGLSHAKMKGLSAANYEILVYTDDDNLLHHEYIEAAFRFMKSNANVGLCGGQSLPLYEETPEEWFEQHKNILAIGTQGVGVEDVTKKRGFMWGAGSVFRKTVLDEACSHGFRMLTAGRRGKILLAGDDLEMSYAVLHTGYKIYYHEGLVLHHYIPKGRIQWRYIKGIYSGYGASTILLDLYEWYYKKKYMNRSCYGMWFRHLLTFVKPTIKYNFLLLGFYRLLPKGSLLATKVAFALGRWNGFIGMKFTLYRTNLEIIRRFCKESMR